MIEYDEQGAGLPVLLIHGFPLCRQMWRPQRAALAAAGYRVICPDLPGFGESPALAGPASMASYAEAVIALMDDLGIEKTVVGGMSMGGYVLLDLLARYPERCTGVMFMVTRAAADDAAGKQKRTKLAAEVKAGNEMIVADAFDQVLFAPETVEGKPQLVTEVREWMEATSPAGIIAGLLAMRDREDYVAKLSGFKLPALVVGADQDLAMPLEHAQALAAGLPQAELKIISDAGHMANLEQTESFNAALLGFLNKFAGPKGNS